jgi:hypothetical protein
MKKALTVLSALVLASVMVAPAIAQNTDITPTEVANFDRYLDNHPEVAQRLATNPQLVNNPQFMNNHPGLEGFLSKHPGVREELHESPGQFMYREGHYQWSRGGPVARFDNGYLDEHPEVAQQLARDPHLVDNPQYLATHPGLDQYFASHPEVRNELQNHPDRFLTREAGYERYENGNAHPLRNTDKYLDTHPEVAQQLEKNPALVDDPKYVNNHPGLHEFLQNHPVARQDWKSHPYRYMNHENHYDQKH